MVTYCNNIKKKVEEEFFSAYKDCLDELAEYEKLFNIKIDVSIEVGAGGEHFEIKVDGEHFSTASGVAFVTEMFGVAKKIGVHPTGLMKAKNSISRKKIKKYDWKTPRTKRETR